MARGSKSVVIYSDIHTGSRRAICTNDPENPSYKPNKFQKMINLVAGFAMAFFGVTKTFI